MSEKSYASGSVHSCGGGGSVRLSATRGTGHEVVLDALYSRKRDKKTVRVLTVIIYVFCVSLAAIMLSLYYVFFWEPKDAQYAQRKVLHTVERQTGTTPMPTCFMPHTGGGDSAVKAHIDPPTQHQHPYSFETSTTVDPSTTEYPESSTVDLDTTTYPNEDSGANETSVT